MNYIMWIVQVIQPSNEAKPPGTCPAYKNLNLLKIQILQETQKYPKVHFRTLIAIQGHPTWQKTIVTKYILTKPHTR